jgi:hypothetical protein
VAVDMDRIDALTVRTQPLGRRAGAVA